MVTTHKSSKSFLIVKQHYKEYAEIIFVGSNIKITTQGARHLGVVLGDIIFKEEYLRNEVHTFMEKSIRNTFKDSRNSTTTCLFCIYVRVQTHISDYLFPIEETLRSRFMPAITGGHICSNAERALLVLPVKFGGLQLQNLCEV